MAKQLHIFLENRPGRLEAVTQALYDSKVNIIAFTIQDRGDFGLMKLMVNKPEQAYLALADKGYACALKDVVFISVPDKPGNLSRLATLLLKNKINIIDAHGFVLDPAKVGICCLELDEKDMKKIRKILAKGKFRVLDEKELYEI
ncbi:MAG: ACT domain-containing protein [Candidatus Omnitrophota bacterium]|jgi:hypothetical protein